MKTLREKTEIQLDGSSGEGGGQILRTALSLSAITGKSFSLRQIRAGRKKAGLMRQHLTCVQAIKLICEAKTSPLEIAAESLDFVPGSIKSYQGEFAIGTAGSTALLLQTVLPVLFYAPERSEVRLRGGTHVIKAPCFEYIDEVFLPRLRELGGAASVTLERVGFFPAGAGQVCLQVEPSTLISREWHEGENKRVLSAEVLVTAEISKSVESKELAKVCSAFALDDKATWTKKVSAACPGNALLIRSEGTVTSSYGERGKRAEQVARDAIWEMQRYLNSSAPVDEYLADQLLLPLALAGGGGFTALALTPHFHSNVEVIEKFLPIKFKTEKLDRFAWKVTVQS